MLFVRAGTLFAQNFDVNKLKLQDKPVRLTDSVLTGADNGSGFAAFSVSDTGVLVYRTENRRGRDTQLTWIDRSGKPLETIGSTGVNDNPRVSPDGRRVAVSVGTNEGAAPAIWIFGPGNISIRVAEGVFPVWSSDGRRLIYLGVKDGKTSVVQKSVEDNAGDEQVLIGVKPFIHVDDISPDNQYIVGSDRSGQTNRDVIAVALAAQDKPIKVAATPAQELFGRISPDGRWIAYSSDEDATTKVYIQAFPHAGRKILVSPNGGTWPVWRRDGKELFYVSLDSKLMAVSISGGSTLQPGIPQPLFDVRFRGNGIGFPSQYDVTPDGKRFLVNMAVAASESEVSPIHVVLNWPELLKK
jgi:Tol biopolymer transport system component